MAQNDAFLIDGILDGMKRNGFESSDEGEIFEYFATAQILKDMDLTKEELLSGSVDGKDDGGLDEFFIFLNGHLIDDFEERIFPKNDAVLELYIISCKHENTFKQDVFDKIYPTITELFDFTLLENSFKGKYNIKILKKRLLLYKIYKQIAGILNKFAIKIIYASRGDETLVAENVKARGNQIEEKIRDFFSGCTCSVEYCGSTELLRLYRKKRKSTLVLPFKEILVDNINHVLLTRLEDFYGFITDEEGKLKRYLFDSNVRAFMGLNRVNTDIMQTLQNADSPDFWLLNNGITILSTKAVVIGKEIYIDDIQIVNGLQTSETIYNYYSNNGSENKSKCVLVKVIVNQDLRTRDSIIKATNNQTSVELYSLHATDKIQKDIEDCLLQYGLYYERRTNYYSNCGYADNLIFTPLYLASGYVTLVERNIKRGISLKQRFMNNSVRYTEIYEYCPLKTWVSIAKILRNSDEVIKKKRKQSNLSCPEGFLKTLRHFVSFLSTANYYKKFVFSANKLSNLDFDTIDNFAYEEMYDFICKNFGEFQKTEWRKSISIQKLLIVFAEEYKISNIEAMISTKDKETKRNRNFYSK